MKGFDELNSLRLLAGISVKSPTKIVLQEARSVPMARHQLAPTDGKTMERRAHNVAIAARHVEQAVKALEKVPATDFMGDVPHMIHQLEEILGHEDASYGLKAIAKTCATEHRKVARAEKLQQQEEEEELAAHLDNEVIVADEKKIVARSLDAEIEEHGHPSDLKESTLDYDPNANAVSWENEDEPVNIAPAPGVPTAYSDKPGRDESPESMVNAANDDANYSMKVSVPAPLKTSLKTEIGELRKEFEKYKGKCDVTATHYNTSADALETILNHLETGTVGGLKQAAIFMPTLMSPILHKIPTDVVDFIARGGQNRSLKQHFFAVKKENM